MWTMNSSQTGSMILTTEGALCFSTIDTFFPDVEIKSIYLHDTRRELLDR